ISTYTSPLPYDVFESSTQIDGATPIRPPGVSRNNGARGSQARLLALINDYRVSVPVADGGPLPPITRPLTPNSLDIRDTDLRISKAFTLKEPFVLRVQAEAFNLFNSPNFVSNSGNAGNAGFGFSGVVGNADSPNVGLPTSTLGALGAGGPR